MAKVCSRVIFDVGYLTRCFGRKSHRELLTNHPVGSKAGEEIYDPKRVNGDLSVCLTLQHQDIVLCRSHSHISCCSNQTKYPISLALSGPFATVSHHVIPSNQAWLMSGSSSSES